MAKCEYPVRDKIDANFCRWRQYLHWKSHWTNDTQTTLDQTKTTSKHTRWKKNGTANSMKITQHYDQMLARKGKKMHDNMLIQTHKEKKKMKIENKKRMCFCRELTTELREKSTTTKEKISWTKLLMTLLVFAFLSLRCSSGTISSFTLALVDASLPFFDRTFMIYLRLTLFFFAAAIRSSPSFLFSIFLVIRVSFPLFVLFYL